MAETCSHNDESRKEVSASAHGVAFMRSLESQLDPELRLFQDPYAAALAGEVGRNFVEGKHGRPTMAMINGMSVRTKRIDDEFESNTLKQICLFGSGLDTRAWRLRKTISEPVHFFEVDFPEVFAFKLSTLQGANAESKLDFEYHAVSADLSVSGWTDRLLGAGYDPCIPTLFVMEGFVNYLTQEEVVSFFTTLSTVAATGSRLVMTCATPVTQASVRMHNLHRFFPEHPLQFFSQFGWSGKQELVEELAKAYNRPLDEANNLQGYFIITAELTK
jgi:methyltransferase (TIGR00027 family)